MTDDVDLPSSEPIAARGVGSERFDQPALFYLTHQALIDEWYSLRRTVAEAVNDWMESTVRESLAKVASDRDFLLSTARGPQGYRHLLLHPQDMPVINTRPIVGIGIAWSPTNGNPRSSAPFACVRRSSIKPGKAACSALLAAGGGAFRSSASLKGRDDDPWPIYSYVQAPPQWWTNLDAYHSAIVGEVERYLDGLTPALVAAASAGSAAASQADLGGEESDDQ